MRLFTDNRWQISVDNLAVYGVLTLIFVFVVGFMLAVLMDQKIRFENAFRTIFLYPFALSFVITGLVWQWMLNPAFGLQKSIRDLGWESFTFDWIANRKMVVYTLVIAGVWQRTGPGDGADAGGPPRHRRRDLEGLARRRHSQMADLHLRSSFR